MIAWTLYITFAGAIALLLLPGAWSRWLALATSVAGCGVAVAAFIPARDFGAFETVVRVPWVTSLGIEYHLAADGISMVMALLTGIVGVGAVLFSWDVKERRKIGRAHV